MDKTFLALVKATLQEAHAAAAQALEDYRKVVELNEQGLIIDTFGNGEVIAMKPSRRLQNALKAMGEVTRDNDGIWWISDFRKYGERSLTASEKACGAAVAVFKAKLTGEGEFTVRIMMER